MTLSPSLSARLVGQLDSLNSLLALGLHALERRPPSGQWSAHENLAHLARHHALTLDRLRRILGEERPPLARYRAEDDPEWPSWSALSAPEVLARLFALRQELVSLAAGLRPDQLARVGVHPVFGPMAIPEWLDFFLLHEAHHLYTAWIRARG